MVTILWIFLVLNVQTSSTTCYHVHLWRYPVKIQLISHLTLPRAFHCYWHQWSFHWHQHLVLYSEDISPKPCLEHQTPEWGAPTNILYKKFFPTFLGFWPSNWICKPTLHIRIIRRVGRGKGSTLTAYISNPLLYMWNIYIITTWNSSDCIHYDRPQTNPSTPNLFSWPGIPNIDRSWNSHSTSSDLILFLTSEWLVGEQLKCETKL